MNENEFQYIVPQFNQKDQKRIKAMIHKSKNAQNKCKKQNSEDSKSGNHNILSKRKKKVANTKNCNNSLEIQCTDIDLSNNYNFQKTKNDNSMKMSTFNNINVENEKEKQFKRKYPRKE
jgi:hypothetical protein